MYISPIVIAVKDEKYGRYVIPVELIKKIGILYGIFLKAPDMMTPKSYADAEIEYDRVVFVDNVKTDTREYPDAFVPPTENGRAKASLI